MTRRQTPFVVAIAFAPILMLGCESSGGTIGEEPEPMTYADYEPVSEASKGSFKGDPEFYADNAQRFYESGDYNAALNQFNSQLELAPDAVDGRLGAAYSRYQIGRQLGAVGNIRDAGGYISGALEEFEKIAASVPMESDTLEGSGFGWKAQLGLALTERAYASLASRGREIIDAELPGLGDEAERRRKLARFAELGVQRDTYNARALARFERLGAMEHAAPDAILNLGDMHLIAGNDVRAERHYVEYLDIARRSIEMWDARAKAAPDEIASKNELATTLAAIEAKRNSAVDRTTDVLIHLAEIKYRQRNFVDAAARLEEALTLAPQRIEIHAPLAECLFELRTDDERALRHLDLFLKRRAGGDIDANVRKAMKLRTLLLERRAANDGAGDD